MKDTATAGIGGGLAIEPTPGTGGGPFGGDAPVGSGLAGAPTAGTGGGPFGGAAAGSVGSLGTGAARTGAARAGGPPAPPGAPTIGAPGTSDAFGALTMKECPHFGHRIFRPLGGTRRSSI